MVLHLANKTMDTFIKNLLIGLAATTSFLVLLLFFVGDPTDMAALFSSLITSTNERRPDIEHKHQFSSDGLKFEYPGNWTVRPSDETAKEDATIGKGWIVKTPGHNAIRFWVASLTDQEAMSDEQLNMLLDELFKLNWSTVNSRMELPPHHKGMSSWGNLKGAGQQFIMFTWPGRSALIKMPPLKYNGVFFVTSSARGKTLIIEELRISGHEIINDPGFDLVKSTIRFE